MTNFMKTVIEQQARAEARQQQFMQAVEQRLAAMRSRSTSPERLATPRVPPIGSEEAGVAPPPTNFNGNTNGNTDDQSSEARRAQFFEIGTPPRGSNPTSSTITWSGLPQMQAFGDVYGQNRSERPFDELMGANATDQSRG